MMPDPAGAMPRGIELIERVIDPLTKTGPAKAIDQPYPLPASFVETLTFAGGAPLSPSLRRWLTFDAAWLEWFPDLANPVLTPCTLTDVMEPGFVPLEELLPEACYSLRPSAGDCSCRFLYVGEAGADDVGEYPVFLADMDDCYLVLLDAPGFDVYLTESLGVLSRPRGQGGEALSWFDHPTLGPAMQNQARRTMRGYRMYEIFGTATSSDGKATQWKEITPPPYDEL